MGRLSGLRDRDPLPACLLIPLVQRHSGQPVREEDGSVAFHDDDLRALGEAMALHYERKSTPESSRARPRCAGMATA